MRGSTVYAVEGGDGDLQRTVGFIAVDEGHHILHRTFAVALGVAHDNGAAVVLECRRNDFRCGGRSAVDHDYKRLAEGYGRVGVEKRLCATALADGDHRSNADEGTCQGDCLAQRAAAIAAEIENHALDLVVEAGHDCLDVLGAAAEVLVARLAHGAVEGGEVNIAEGASLYAHHAACCGGLLKLDVVADEVDDLGCGAAGVGAADHMQHDLGALFATYALHDLVEGQVNDVLDGVVALSDAEDLVAVAQADVAGVAVCGAAGDDLHDLCHAVFRLERSADAAEGEVHFDVEVLGAHWRHI